MKILVVGEFDPCGVHLRHRKYLRELGHDYRLAVNDCYRPEARGADWWVNDKTSDGLSGFYDRAGLLAFAMDADIIQVLPSIGQPWSFQDEKEFERIDLDLLDICRGRRVACFHGSRNLAANIDAYALHYRAHGFALVATTLDYVAKMNAGYLPSIVEDIGAAELKERGGPFKVAHSPTDPSQCSTGQFLERAERACQVHYIRNLPHVACLELKRRCHAAFDHLRGAFSVNSLENAAMGLVNLVAVRPEYRAFLEESLGVTLPFPNVQTMDDVMDALITFNDDHPAVAREQVVHREWFLREWTPMQNAKRIEAVYQGLL